MYKELTGCSRRPEIRINNSPLITINLNCVQNGLMVHSSQTILKSIVNV
jgi:hypothetical protein